MEKKKKVKELTRNRRVSDNSNPKIQLTSRRRDDTRTSLSLDPPLAQRSSISHNHPSSSSQSPLEGVCPIPADIERAPLIIRLYPDYRAEGSRLASPMLERPLRARSPASRGGGRRFPRLRVKQLRLTYAWPRRVTTVRVKRVNELPALPRIR